MNRSQSLAKMLSTLRLHNKSSARTSLAEVWKEENEVRREIPLGEHTAWLRSRGIGRFLEQQQQVGVESEVEAMRKRSKSADPGKKLSSKSKNSTLMDEMLSLQPGCTMPKSDNNQAWTRL